MQNQSNIFIKTEPIEWEQVAPGMKRKFMGFDDEIMMVKVHFEKGGIGVRHEHRHSQTTYVESGQFEVTVGEKTEVLKGGDGFYIPPHVEHGAVCLEEGILIDVFSPIREDFIGGKNGNSK
jgi:quercetin dioxygenase-like cupin family protein